VSGGAPDRVDLEAPIAGVLVAVRQAEGLAVELQVRATVPDRLRPRDQEAREIAVLEEAGDEGDAAEGAGRAAMASASTGERCARPR
jgi:hypothetical protein